MKTVDVVMPRRSRIAAPTNVRRDAATSENLSLLVGVAAVVFSVLYFVSDLIELAQRGFSIPQLALTYAGEAAIPLFVIGLYAVQRPRIGRLGLAAAIGYAYTFIFFTGTVSFALVNRTPNWDSLTHQMGAWVTIHGVLMVLTGLAFGLAVVRAGVLPRWTGWTLMAGVVLVAASSGLSDVAQTASAGIRDLAFAGMGASLLATFRRGLRR
jgi:tryptophan-rich sensory protein